MKLTRSMPSFEGVAANSTATCRLPLGLTYNQIMLTLGGTTFTSTHMTEIRLVANGKPVQRWSGVDLDKINQYEGRAASSTAKVLFLDLERFGLRTKLAQELTAIPTGAQGNPVPITTLQLEVDIGAATAPTLSARAVQTAPRNLAGKLQPIKQVRKFQYTPAGTGIYEISDLPKLGGAEINRVIFKTSATVADITLELDGYTAFERTTAENGAVQIDGGRTPQSGYYVVDTTEDGNGGETIKTATIQDMRFKLNITASAATITVYVEYLEPIKN